MIIFRDILEAIAEDLGQNPYPNLRYTGEVTGQPSFTNDDGVTSYFVSWNLGAAPLQADIDAKAIELDANPPAEDPSDLGSEELFALISSNTTAISSLTTVVNSLQTSVTTLESAIVNKFELITKGPLDPVPAGDSAKILLDAGLNCLFTWYPNAGTSGEWLSIGSFAEGGGVNATNVTPGVALRRYNGMSMNTDTGIPAPEGVPLRLMGGWATWQGTSNLSAVHVLKGSSVIAIIDSGPNRPEALTKLFDISDPNYRVLIAPGDNLWLRWNGNNGVSRPQATIQLRISLVPT